MDNREKNLLIKLLIGMGILGINSTILFAILAPLGETYTIPLGIGTFVSMYTIGMLISFEEVRK